MKVLNVTNEAVDLGGGEWPFQQGASVLAFAASGLQLQGSATGEGDWESIGPALTASQFAPRTLTHRFVRCSTEATIQLLST